MKGVILETRLVPKSAVATLEEFIQYLEIGNESEPESENEAETGNE